MPRLSLRLLLAATMVAATAGLVPTVLAPAAVADAETCTSGARTLSLPGDRVYPEMGNGGYASVHTDLHIAYDTLTNLFLPGTHADLTQQASQCLSDFSLDFERTNANSAGPNMSVSSVLVNGAPATFAFKQPTYPGDPNGVDDPDPAAHAISNVNPVSATNPNPPACSPSVSGGAQNGSQCPANKLVITPAAPVPSGSTFTVTVNYTGRPGVHIDGDGSTEGWFRINSGTAVNDGGFVTTEPIGSIGWMPLNNHPSAKPTYDVYDTVPVGKTAISAGALETTQTNPVLPTSVNAPDANFPAGSWTWHWHSPEPIANYLVTNTIGSYDMTVATSPTTGVQYYEAMASTLTATRKTAIKVVLDTHDDITAFQSTFAGPFPFTADGTIVALANVGFAEEMQTKITFGNGASSTPTAGTFAHENMHQWFGDNVSEAAFNLTFWKEGWATIGEYLATARASANAAGGLGSTAGQTAFDTSLNNRFTTNYGATGSAWTVAPSNPTVGNLFTTANTYTRPGTAYLALRQILDASATRSASDRWIAVMKDIQQTYAGRSITEQQLEDVFHAWVPNQSAGCHTRLDTFFTQWFDTAYPSGGGLNKPQITGLNFYDDNGACPRAVQNVDFPAITDRTFGDPDFTVSATTDSGLPMTFSATGACTVTGVAHTVHLTTGGSCTVTAAQAGDGVYKPASVQRTFAVARAGQAISFAALDDRTFGDADFGIVATATSGLPVGLGADGSCSVSSATSPANVHLTTGGSCTITATQPGNSSYLPAESVDRSFSIAKAEQSISFPALPDKTYGDADITLAATATSGLAATYAASGACSVSGAVLHLTGLGSCTVTASQVGDASYNPAADVTRSFSVAAATTSTLVTITSSPTQYSDVVTLSASISSAGAGTQSGSVAFTIGGTAVGTATVSGGVATLSDVVIGQNPATYVVGATFTSTNPDFLGSASTKSLVVSREDATVDNTGNSLFWTPSTSATSGAVTLSAVVTDAADGHSGDIRTAKVTFVNRENGNAAFAGCSNLSVGLINAADPTVGLASCSTTLSTGSSGGETYTVGTVVSANYTRDSSSDDVLVTIAQPVTTSFITGGGFVKPIASSGLLPADPGSKSHAGFTVKFNKSGSNLQGNANVIFTSGGRTYQVKSNALASLVTTSTAATFTTKANLVDITNPALPITVDSGITLQLWMTDRPTGDTLGIQVLRKAGGLWFSSSWVGARTTEMPLAGGNLAVH